jgi:hypothetical protein
MHVDFEKIDYKIECLENCIDSEDEGVVVNLCPETVIEKDFVHEDGVFPGMMEAMKLIEKHNLVEKFKPKKITPESYIDISREWPFIKQLWSLFVNEKHDLLRERLREYYKKDEVEESDFLQLLYDFVRKIPGKKWKRHFLQISSFIEKTKKEHSANYADFLKYLFDRLDLKHFNQYLDFFDEYFSGYTEYAQVGIHLMLDEEISGNLIATSVHFKKTKMFYGNAYELFTSNIELLATLNNVAKSRNFDQFESMDLQKYRTIDKANRCNPFKDTPELISICECLDNKLRNASHHGAIRYNHKTKQVHYMAGKPSREYIISYAQYLGKCVEIMMAVCTLLIIELSFMYAKYRPRQ